MNNKEKMHLMLGTKLIYCKFPNSQLYPYNTLLTDIEPGDFDLVRSKAGLGIAEVRAVEIANSQTITCEYNKDTPWAFEKYNPTKLDALLKLESEIVEVFDAVDKTKTESKDKAKSKDEIKDRMGIKAFSSFEFLIAKDKERVLNINTDTGEDDD